MKKTIAIILSLATLTLTANLFPLTAAAVELNPDYSSSEQTSVPITIIDSGVCGDDVTWTLDSNYCLTISGTGKMGGWNTSNSMPWYKYRNLLKSVKINPGVTSIHSVSFSNFYYLESVEIPDTITTIGWHSFSDCRSLKSLELPRSVVDIQNGAFQLCASLKNIKVSPDNPNYCDVDGVLYNKDKTTLMIYPAQREGATFTFPKTVQIIDYNAFNCCENLTSIKIPDEVTTVRSEAFYKCTGLTSITIHDAVTEIELRAFYKCTALKTIKLPASVKSIGLYAFYDCESLEDIFIYSKECEITDSEVTLPKDTIIRGYSGSLAEEYAVKYEREFVDFSFGDVNRDGLINAVDASLVISAYAMIAVGKDSDFDKNQMISADVNDNENIDAIDASVILGYYAYSAIGGEDSFDIYLKK